VNRVYTSTGAMVAALVVISTSSAVHLGESVDHNSARAAYATRSPVGSEVIARVAGRGATRVHVGTGKSPRSSERNLAVPSRHSLALPQVLDHYQCYKLSSQSHFSPRTVSLVDQFGQRQARVLALTQLCNPAVLNHQGQINSPNGHLVCYTVKAPSSALPPVFVSNQLFGMQRLIIGARRSLCLPSGMSLDLKHPVGIPPGLDHYLCYQAKGSVRQQSVSVTDQFGSSSARVLSVNSLCAPVSKNNSGITNPTDHLVC
jgi:hypothetical protein